MNKCAGNKTPGRDGICLEFFKTNWETITDILALFNQMYRDGKILEQQKHGRVVCMPKAHGPSTPADYRPITLLNTDYNTLARIIANRRRPLSSDLLHLSHYCGMIGSTIFDAVATVRDTMAHAEATQDPLCLLSLDNKEAFDKISNTYLFRLMRNCGFSKRFITLIRQKYDQATSPFQINWHLAGPIPIRCSVRQGCPMTVLLFALSLHPLLHGLQQKLT